MRQTTRLLILTVLCFAPLRAGAAVPLPADSEYVVVKDGHLSVDGQRVRYWAAIGKMYVAGKDRAGTDAIVQRLQDLGFNATRFWRGFNEVTEYTPGDGSDADSVDYFVKKMKDAGLKIWLASLNQAGTARPEDVAVLDDPATAAAWREAVQQVSKGGKGWDIRNNPARIWDPRLEALAIQRMKNVATHFNPHTGLRWCDDPVFAVWELSNEEWWMRRMVTGGWQKLPAFFRNQLVGGWNDFLQQKYGTDAKLRVAWKDLLPGENLTTRTILLAPMAGATKTGISLNDANPQAVAAVQSLKQEYQPSDFAPQRGADVLEFFMDLQLKHKQREAAALRPLGKSTRLSPWVYDTGIGYEIQSQYLHQNADAVAHDAYVNGGYRQDRVDKLRAEAAAATDVHTRNLRELEAERIQNNAGPWVNWLLKPPGISQGVPWLEHNKVEGKPYFAYETQIQQPAKYRADFPLRHLALDSIQDWDFVCWHYFAPGDDTGTAARPFDKPLDITTGAHPQGYHFTFDEVQTAMMRLAGLAWRQNLLAPAAKPTQFIYGRRSLYDPASMQYAGSYGATGLDMLQTVYQYGCRIRIDPTRDDDQVIGPVVKFADRQTHNPYTPTDEIVMDWKKGFLSFDAPGVVAWTGLLARFGDKIVFKNGVTLQNVVIHNPPGIFEPVADDEKYIAFGLATRDGKPLAQCRRATLSLVSTSFNSGFKLASGGKQSVAGKLPVLVARVGATVAAPALDGMKYSFRDWHLKEIGAGVIRGGVLKIPADQPVFCVELERN
jgi:hypothetical protein